MILKNLIKLAALISSSKRSIFSFHFVWLTTFSHHLSLNFIKISYPSIFSKESTLFKGGTGREELDWEF